jgi:tryptophanyl-tRNA synthetase
MKKIALTGIKPTGTPHLGNYLGMIKPALELVDDYQALYFIADVHALITVKDRSELEKQIYQVAATWLALGLDPRKVIFFRQSDIPEVFELAWILACFTAKGLLNRAHAYKAAVAANIENGRSPDADVNVGLFSYPVLMAADILLFGSRIVPVGSDQKQHVEIARDIAAMVNQSCGRVFLLPETRIRDEVMTIPGLDGRKMSKTYGNTIPIFAEPDLLRKRVMAIVTDSRRLEAPKNPDDCTVFAIYKHFASPESIETTRRGYTRGGLAYSVVKQELLNALEKKIGPLRAAYRNFLETPDRIDQILSSGATEARKIAAPILEKVRRKIGIRR